MSHQRTALERDVERTRACREARWRGHVPVPPPEKREPTPEELAAAKEKQAEDGRLAAEKRWENHETPEEPAKEPARRRTTRAERANGVLCRTLAVEAAFSRPERIRELERQLRLYPGEPTRYADVFSVDMVRVDDLGASEPLCDTMALDEPESSL
jgi:hypothetical protein